VIRSLRRAWRYLTAALDGKLDAMLDPRVQIDQAIDEAKHRHALLTEQAAAVRANERELDVRIARKAEEAERLRSSAEQSLLLADREAKAGRGDRAGSYERTARAFAGQLTAVESSLGDLRALLGQARAASTAAMRGVEQNAFALQQQVNERARLLTELEAAKLQERMADAMRQFSVSGPHPLVPTLEDVRERVDRRLAHATARGELLAENVDARMVDVRKAAIDLESEHRLDEIRAGLGLAAAASEKEEAS
jgi:phage shock protein A